MLLHIQQILTGWQPMLTVLIDYVAITLTRSRFSTSYILRILRLLLCRQDCVDHYSIAQCTFFTMTPCPSNGLASKYVQRTLTIACNGVIPTAWGTSRSCSNNTFHEDSKRYAIHLHCWLVACIKSTLVGMGYGRPWIDQWRRDP